MSKYTVKYNIYTKINFRSCLFIVENKLYIVAKNHLMAKSYFNNLFMYYLQTQGQYITVRMPNIKGTNGHKLLCTKQM